MNAYAFSEAWLADYHARQSRVGGAAQVEPVPAPPISIRLELPLPPSVNALYANVPGTGRVKTKVYREWIKAATAQASAQSFSGRIEGTFTAEIDVFQRASGDLDGRIKALMDFCKTIGAIRDDRYLVSLRVDLFPGEPRVLLRLNERSNGRTA